MMVSMVSTKRLPASLCVPNRPRRTGHQTHPCTRMKCRDGVGTVPGHSAGYQPLVHVHDALLIEVPIDRVEDAKLAASKLLTREQFGIIFKSEMKQGKNWLEASGG